MTDANLMDADCIHGRTWWDCAECEAAEAAEALAEEALRASPAPGEAVINRGNGPERWLIFGDHEPGLAARRLGNGLVLWLRPVPVVEEELEP